MAAGWMATIVLRSLMLLFLVFCAALGVALWQQLRRSIRGKPEEMHSKAI